MNIEYKVTNPELSKRMKKLGWDYETERYWNWNVSSAKWILMSENMALKEVYPYEESIPAPDAIEIGERFPNLCLSGRGEMGWNCWIFSNMWERGYYNTYVTKTEADARGEMWCYLKEKKLK